MVSHDLTMEDVLCFGDCNVDIVVPVTEIPVKGGCTFSEEMSVNIGGSMINTAVALTKLGAHVGIVTKIGYDLFGNNVIDYLKEKNIGTEHLIRSSYPTGIAFALVEDDGEKRWIAIRKNAADLHINTSETDKIPIPKKLFITGVELVEGLESRQSAIEFAKKVKANGGMVFLDPNIRIPVWELNSDIRNAFNMIFPYIDVLLSNEVETVMLGSDTDPKSAAQKLLGYGIGTVWVKLGDKGCLFVNPEEIIAFDPVKVKVVDTCGSGDAFNAAIIYAYINGWKTDHTGRFANRFASYTVGRHGSTTSLPEAHEVSCMLEEIFNDTEQNKNEIQFY